MRYTTEKVLYTVLMQHEEWLRQEKKLDIALTNDLALSRIIPSFEDERRVLKAIDECQLRMKRCQSIVEFISNYAPAFSEEVAQ